MTTTTRGTTWMFLAVAALALLIASAVPAGATVIQRSRYSFDFADRYDGCGFEVVVEGTVSGQLRIRAGTGQAETAFFLRDAASYTETHTNAETGDFLAVEGRVLFNEVRATRVEGDVFEFTAIEAGQPFVVSDSDGNVVLRDRGVVQYHVLFDTGGDDVPGGETLDLSFEPRGPHPGLDADFCDIIAPLIGS